VSEFVAKSLHHLPNRFVKDFEPVATQIAQAGLVNSLAQLVLKATLPGVPDFYQGCECWDFSLVDPDNRRPVDYEARARMLDSLEGAEAAELFEHWHDGRIKMFLTRALLHFRREHRALFEAGELVPLPATGAFKDCCVAFLRRLEDRALLVVVPRLSHRTGFFPPTGAAWRDTALELPAGLAGGQVRNLFTGEELHADGSGFNVSTLLLHLPVAVFTIESTARPNETTQ